MKKRGILGVLVISLIIIGAVWCFFEQKPTDILDVNQQIETNDAVIQQPVQDDITTSNLTVDQLTEDQIALFESTSLLLNEEVILGEITLEEMDIRQDEAITDAISQKILPDNGLDLFREWKTLSGFYDVLEEKILSAEEERNKSLSETVQSDGGDLATQNTKNNGVFSSEAQTSVSLSVGQSVSIALSTKPADAEIKVSTNNPQLECKLNNRELTITALSATAGGVVTVIVDGEKYGATNARLEIIVDIIPPLSTTEINSYKRQILELVNNERTKAGLAPLNYTDALQYAADVRAEEISRVFSHTRPNGSSCFTALQGVQYATSGENIAKGQKSPERVMEGWMNSPGHRANILESDYTGMAVGVFQYGGVLYWVQFFIG